jgi:hypothetical protein
MFGAVAEFVSTQHGDSAEFMGKAHVLAIGVARDYEPARPVWEICTLGLTRRRLEPSLRFG